MLMTKALRRVATWLALLAIALSALWPVVANARPGYANLAKTLCSTTRPANAAENLPQSATHLTPHCAFCAVSADNNVVPAADSVPAVVATDAEESRPNFEAGRTPAPPGYTPAHPRAPPSVS
jgi:hypothetical protein